MTRIEIGHLVEVLAGRNHTAPIWDRAVIVSDACGNIRVRMMRTGMVRKVGLDEMREVQ